jgi:hypothetical protein
MGLATKQGDYMAVFVHAPIDEDVYVEMPQGFAEHGQVLKLKRSLYGLKQSPINFFLFLKAKLEAAVREDHMRSHWKGLASTYEVQWKKA